MGFGSRSDVPASNLGRHLPGYTAPVIRQLVPHLNLVRWLIRSIVLTVALSTLGGAAQEPGERQGPKTPVPLGPTTPPELEAYARDWPTAQGNLAGTRAARDATINAENVDQLDVAWRFPLVASSGWGGMTATPLVAGNTVYVQDMQSNVFALNRNTGKVEWKHEYNVNSAGPNGLALGYGRIYGVLGDTAEVFALSARTGVERWRVKLSGNSGEGIDMAPLVYDNTVYVSTAPSNSRTFYGGGQKGVFFALDAGTGSVMWQFDTTSNLWGNPRINSGGGLWYPPSVDHNGNIYFGTGNPGPWPGTHAFPNGSSRPGDNDYASSMVSLNPKTGAVRWSVNARPHDLFDLDFQNTPVLVRLQTDAGIVKLAIGSGKTGTVIAANADTGQLVWQTAVGKHQNDDLTELPMGKTVEIYPGNLGGIETPISYANGTLFVPVVNLSRLYKATGFVIDSGELTSATGELVALDVRDGSLKWQVELPQGAFGGTAVANDVVFVSTLDGVFAGYDVKSGERLWSYQASSGFNAPPAIAGDMVFVAAAGPLVARAVQPEPVTPAAGSLFGSNPTATPAPAPASVMDLIAFRISQPQSTATAGTSGP
ncbi:MAG: PQQ-binding-like beta-propeller repeat protein [Thermomicrobiales bacterium]